MNPAPKRRWSFSLRTMFVVVTVFCCGLGWELHVVQERREMLHYLEGRGAFIRSDELMKPGILAYYLTRPERPRKSFSIPLVRQLLGDKAIVYIATFDQDHLSEVQRIFPEAEVVKDSSAGFP